MLRRYEDDRLKSSRAGRLLPLSAFQVGLCLALALVPVLRVSALPLSAPKAASMNIRTVTEGGVKWVRSTTEVCAVFPIPLEAYRTVLMDVAAYPNYVPHLKSVDLFTTPSGVRAMRQHFEVRILGFVFTSIFAMTIEPEDSLLPGLWRTHWNFVDSDGTIGSAAGYWELMDVSEGGESRVLVRNVNDGTVRKKVPFQTSIMRRVAEREMAASLLNGYHEALRRWPQLSGAKTGAAVEILPSYRADEGGQD